MNSTTSGKVLYEDLDTTFVNLWSLLRNLTQRGFIGRVRVELADYSADIFLTGSSTPLVHEVDRKAKTEILEETALHRVVVRARETPGKISVFEGAREAVAVQNRATSPSRDDTRPETQVQPPVEAKISRAEYFDPEPSPALPPLRVDTREEPGSRDEFDLKAPSFELDSTPEAGSQLPVTVTIGGELIGAVERGVVATGENFASIFHQVRLELGDDFSFLDPMSNGLEYANGVASLNHDIPAAVYVSGVSEALRRTVDRVAVGDRARRIRERIALELWGVARKRKEALEHSKFNLQLDRIAGTKVI